METPEQKGVNKPADQETSESNPATQEEPSNEDAQQTMLTQRDGIKIILQNRLIVLSPLKFEDFPLTRVLEHTDMRTPTEYHSVIMAKLINNILARSKLTPEELEILRGSTSQDLLRTYHTIGIAIEKALTEMLIG